MPKKKPVNHLPYRIDMHTCYQWCMDNGITIYPLASNESEKQIEINDNGTIIQSPVTYSKIDLYTKIWELYCHYYDTRANLHL